MLRCYVGFCAPGSHSRGAAPVLQSKLAGYNTVDHIHGGPPLLACLHVFDKLHEFVSVAEPGQQKLYREIMISGSH
eukprot:scaffold65225_cov19-Tisochrysis_lutea.AAC.2